MTKLVRDKIPEVIIQSGGSPKIHFADNEEFWQKLKEKLVEETNEFIAGENEEELADIYEVLDAIISFKKFDKMKINEIKNRKLKEREGFVKRIILE